MKNLLILALVGVGMLDATYQCPLKVFDKLTKKEVDWLLSTAKIMHAGHFTANHLINTLVIVPRSDGSYTIGIGTSEPGTDLVNVKLNGAGMWKRVNANEIHEVTPEQHVVVDSNSNMCGSFDDYAATFSSKKP